MLDGLWTQFLSVVQSAFCPEGFHSEHHIFFLSHDTHRSCVPHPCGAQRILQAGSQ